MVMLKILSNNEWHLLQTDEEFSEEELEPYKKTMEAKGVAVLLPNERVKIAPRKYSKSAVLEILSRSEHSCPNSPPRSAGGVVTGKEVCYVLLSSYLW